MVSVFGRLVRPHRIGPFSQVLTSGYGRTEPLIRKDFVRLLRAWKPPVG